jgi:hypothetical protein
MKKLFALYFLAYMIVGSFAEAPLVGWAGLIGLALLIALSRPKRSEPIRAEAARFKVTAVPNARRVPATNLFSY